MRRLQSENFSADVSADIQSKFDIRPNADIHGDEGPLSVAYPRFFYNQSGMILSPSRLHPTRCW